MPEYLSYDKVDWLSSNDVDGIFAMSPPFIGEDGCLLPGEPVVRVERAPQNSRRIFAGIDIPSASVNDVWELLTDYPNLGRVVPNLVVNEVLEILYGDDGGRGGGERPVERRRRIRRRGVAMPISRVAHERRDTEAGGRCDCQVVLPPAGRR